MTSAPAPHDVTAIVLAGGRSTRFGADKLAAAVDGVSVLDRAIAAVSAVAGDVVVCGPSAIRSAGAPVRRALDREPFGGPLQALAGGLETASTELAIVVAGDMPSLVPSVLALQLESLRELLDVDAVVLADPVDSARRQPLPAAIRVDPATRAAAAALEAGDRSLVRLLGRLRVAEIAVDRWRALDPDARTLIDIDHPEDLDRLRRVENDQRKR